MAHRCYYGDKTGALVHTTYTKHAARLLHMMTHNHQLKVSEAAPIRIKEV